MLFIIDAIQQNPIVFFFTLAALLLILELLGTCGYLLWCGISALMTGIIASLFPISLWAMWILFSCFALIFAYLWWVWLKKNSDKQMQGSRINQKYQDLIGMETIVTQVFIQGQGRVKIYDGSWKANCSSSLKLGEKVRVIAVSDLVLTVEKI